MMTQSALLALVLLGAEPSVKAPPLSEREENFGAVIAPVVLPANSTAAYIYAGLAELGAGYRYGLGLLEFEGRVRGDWRFLSLAAEGLMKVSVLEQGGWELAPFLGLGFVANGGAQYLAPANFSYLAIRVLGGFNAHYRVADTVYLVGTLEMTLDLAVSPGNAARFTPLIGPGVEVYLNPQISISALGLLGPDLFHPAPDVNFVELGYGLRLGVGFRFF